MCEKFPLETLMFYPEAAMALTKVKVDRHK